MEFYVGLFRDGLAPVVTYNQVGNVYQDFARGDYAFFITGPWNLGFFASELPAELQDAWATAPMPAPDDRATPGAPGHPAPPACRWPAAPAWWSSAARPTRTSPGG